MANPFTAELMRREQEQAGLVPNQPPSMGSPEPTAVAPPAPANPFSAELQRRREEMEARHTAQTASLVVPPDSGMANAPPEEMAATGAPEAPPIPSPVGMPRTLEEYGIEAGRNLPGSVEAVGQGAWDAIASPVETAKGIGQAVLGGAQLGKDYLGVPSNEILGDFRPQAEAVGEHFERYGPDRIVDTFRRDPAGTLLDVGGAATGVAGAARGATSLLRPQRIDIPDLAPDAEIDPAAVRAASGQDRTPDDIAALTETAVEQAKATREVTRTRNMTDKEFIESAPTLDQLKSQANALYKAADEAGVHVSGRRLHPHGRSGLGDGQEGGARSRSSPEDASHIHQIMSETVGAEPVTPGTRHPAEAIQRGGGRCHEQGGRPAGHDGHRRNR